MTRGEAAAALEAFVHESDLSKFAVTPGLVVQEFDLRQFAKTHMLGAIAHALDCYVKGRTDAEARDCAKQLELAADHYLREVLNAEFVWPSLQFKAEESALRDGGLLGLKRPPIKYFGRRTAKQKRDAWLPKKYNTWLPDHYDATLSAGLVRSAAKATADALRRGKRPPDMARQALGLSFADIFSQLKGRPTFSSGATLEAPGTQFGHFVSLAILASSHAEHPRVKRIAGALGRFVRDAVGEFERRHMGAELPEK